MAIRLLLRCKDRSQTRNFYAEVLGFELEDGPEGTCTAVKEGCTLLFTEADLWRHAPTMTGTVYCFIADVQTYYDRLNNAIKLAWPLEQMSYGTQEFGVVDCNGYTLAFAQAECTASLKLSTTSQAA